jgi:hypothetical protein
LAGLLKLLQTLRREAIAKLWINLTTGMWPSPFWLLYGDSVWRGHGDLGIHGDGSRRQQWISYRDAVVHKLVVSRSSLFPLSALMLHGIVTGAMGQSRAVGLDRISDMAHFAEEVWSYMSMGVQLQELYISPDRLPAAAWDVIAAAAQRARAHAELLQRTVWLGGDAVRLLPYGWSAVRGLDATMTLRNPRNVTQASSLTLGQAFRLPAVCRTATVTAHLHCV